MSTSTAARFFFSALLCAGSCTAALGCSGSSDDTDSTDSSTDGNGSDTASGDTDTCTDEDCEPCDGSDCLEELPCIFEVRGRIVFDDGKPMKGAVPICTPQCTVVNSDQYGNFVRSLGPVCTEFDFSKDEGIHVTVMYAGGKHAMYSGSFEPTAEELGEGGVLDVGTLTLYALPEPVATYTEAAGVSVDSEGLRFTLPPGALVELNYDGSGNPLETAVEQVAMQVLRAPLDAWSPPFGKEVEPELLYFVGPYWGLLHEPVSVEVDAPASWADGTTVGVYMLGEYLSEWGGASDTIYRGEEGTCTSSGELSDYITVGEFARCGTATVEAGVLVSPPLPRLGWYGFKAQ
ncbi:MAG: hypothetical protein MUC50_04340 [Myxococcota bacterium]|jgi:hypothetical protein|nr:hypothetical protein [Myxococcota bacterium]